MVETDKRELIIKGAIKRFAHFGVNKTTMAEIAEDLSFSKPALYYYFPDKQNLIIAVAEKLISEYLLEVESNLQLSAEPEAALIDLIDLRRNFSQKYFMLHIGDEHSEAYLKNKAFKDLMRKAKEKEVSIISVCLQKGIQKGRFKTIDTMKMAELFLDTLKGLRVCMLMENSPFPNADSFELLLNKQKEVAQLFINGIKNYGDGRADTK